MPVATPGGSLVDGSGAIATGGTAEDAFPVNHSRQYLLIQNISSENLWVNFGTDANQDQPSILVGAGGALEFGAGNTGVVPTARVSVIAATTGSKYVAKEA